MRQVTDYALWLGHVGDARDLTGLLSTGIVAVVDLARDDLRRERDVVEQIRQIPRRIGELRLLVQNVSLDRDELGGRR